MPGVSMPPGATELTRIPRVAYSAATVFVRAMTPPLAAA
jgi:hypothetical protein